MKRIRQSLDFVSRSERQTYLSFRQENTTRAVAGIDAGLINGH